MFQFILYDLPFLGTFVKFNLSFI